MGEIPDVSWIVVHPATKTLRISIPAICDIEVIVSFPDNAIEITYLTDCIHVNYEVRYRFTILLILPN